jgi:hypothetical protein
MVREWHLRFVGVICLLLLPSACVGRKPAAAPPQKAEDWITKRLFDGKSLKGWKIAEEVDFTDHGKVYVENGAIKLNEGHPYTGMVCTEPLPTEDFEIALDAMRVKGIDIFCGLNFPVGKESATFVVGGWSGNVVGISCVNDMNASENETTRSKQFELNRWYRIKVRVTAEKIEAWIDQEKMVDLPRADRRFTIYSTLDPIKPMGLFTWSTAAAVRDLMITRLKP